MKRVRRPGNQIRLDRISIWKAGCEPVWSRQIKTYTQTNPHIYKQNYRVQSRVQLWLFSKIKRVRTEEHMDIRMIMNQFENTVQIAGPPKVGALTVPRKRSDFLCWTEKIIFLLPYNLKFNRISPLSILSFSWVFFFCKNIQRLLS